MKYTTNLNDKDTIFKYSILFNTMLDFHYTRQWLIKSYGYGLNMKSHQCEEYNRVTWGYILERHAYMIYLRNDDMLIWFKLKYGESNK
jgi:hypothetical protein